MPISGHPWVLFYTECPLKVVTANLCVANKILTPRIPWDTLRSECESLSDSSERSDDKDECGIVDALTAAITHVRISEPKRSRLCSPAITIQQECSSNLKSNLCTAFWPDPVYSSRSEWCPFFWLRRLVWFKMAPLAGVELRIINSGFFQQGNERLLCRFSPVIADEPDGSNCCKFCK